MARSTARQSLAFMALALFLGVPLAAGPAPRNAVPISIYWSKAPGKAALSNVAFEDANLGAINFTANSDHFAGTRQADGSWAFHDVTLSYGSEAAPLALRTRAGTPGIRIDVAMPNYTACRREILDGLKKIPSSAPIPTRINAMLSARHLLALHSNMCPEWAQKDLAEIYFVMSCSLAKQSRFFRVPEEAKDRYRQLGRKTASGKDEEIAACDRQTYGLAVLELDQAAKAALAKKDIETFGSINEELGQLASDPDWAGGLSAQGLDEDTLRARSLKLLYGQQQEALQRKDFDGALQQNSKLKELLDDKEFSRAFDKVSLDEKRLEEDRAFIENMKPADEPTEPQ